MLNKLKTEFNNLVKITTEKVNEIEKVLGEKLLAYKQMNTKMSWLRNLSDTELCEVYQRRINTLKEKLKHSEEFLMAVNNKNEYLIGRFDLFNEIGNEANAINS